MNVQEKENLLHTEEISASKNSEKPSTSNTTQRRKFLEILEKILSIIFLVLTKVY